MELIFSSRVRWHLLLYPLALITTGNATEWPVRRFDYYSRQRDCRASRTRRERAAGSFGFMPRRLGWRRAGGRPVAKYVTPELGLGHSCNEVPTG